MLIEEIVRSCANERVAHAAVASIGPKFARDVGAAAETHGMSVGNFTAQSVRRFARTGCEADIRAVRAAMHRSQEPILAGLHRILSIILAADAAIGARRDAENDDAMIPAQVCAWQLETRRERHHG